MKILTKKDTYDWLEKHNFRYKLPEYLSIEESDSLFCTNLVIELPGTKHSLVFDPSLRKDRMKTYLELANWMVNDPVLIFTEWSGYWGFSNREFTGSLEEYLHEICPDYAIGTGGLALEWDPTEPGMVNRMVNIFDDCLERNWEAYVLQADDASCVWLDDELIEVRTNNTVLFEMLEHIIAD